MSDLPELDVEPRVAAMLPPWTETMQYIRKSPKRAPVEVLRAAAARGRPVVQPRCGVGGHDEMRTLLATLERRARPGILTITIDSFTRLKQFRTAAQTLQRDPADLNGYPLVTHGWRRGRELNELVDAPIEVRHGSPDPRELFAVSLASGFTSFEGGGIDYNLPYSKDVSLTRSLAAWAQVDRLCGVLAEEGVIVDRELFGTLTAVLVPPSVSLAVCVLEARAASLAGVRCLSIAYPQGGEVHQDIAALRSIPVLARRYLPETVEIFPVLHEFMGVFPADPDVADALILYGGLTARLGGAAKVINKTNQEARGIPDAQANVDGIRTAALACTDLLDFVRVDEATVEEETYWLQREVAELVEPVLAAPDLAAAITGAFADGRLDIPFSASVHARSEVIPKRDATGAIRYLNPGGLPFSRPTLRRNEQCLRVDRASLSRRLIDEIRSDINFFLHAERRFQADRATVECPGPANAGPGAAASSGGVR
ncbi:methylaspartate mutase [Micromonospora sp. NPDC049374]|uniref:methylaspartate mutase n=1 Tax=Micromonospora sp. NPDC049374 TaxID=3154352 RepID=UPI00341C4EB5